VLIIPEALDIVTVPLIGEIPIVKVLDDISRLPVAAIDLFVELAEEKSKLPFRV